MIKAVFFDLGGTLLKLRRDSIFRAVLAENGHIASLDKIHSAYASAESAWLRRYGFRNLSPDRSVESYRRLDAMAFRRVVPGATSQEVLKVSRLMRKRWPELEDRFPPVLYQDAIPTLRRLKRKRLSLGLVSNAPPDTRGVVLRLGLQRYMKNIIISGEVGVSKPNPAIFRLALHNAGVRPTEAIHVGDVFEADVVGAEKAGMKGVLIDRDGASDRYDCPTIKILDEVVRFLDGPRQR